MVVLNGPEEMIEFGEKMGRKLFPHSVITMTGELGAGKTTLTKGIGKGLGVKKIISSPTFTIVKIYQGRMPLYHFDAYRLEGSDDDLGFEEMFDDEGVCVVEWPMYIEDILPEERLEIEIVKNDENTRTLIFYPTGSQYEAFVQEIMYD